MAMDMEENRTYNIDEALTTLGFGRFQFCLLLYAGLAWFGDAMEVMILSYLGPATKCEWALTSSGESLLTSVVFVGMAVGSSLWGALSDARGRRASFMGSAVLTSVFSILSALSPNYTVLLLTRMCVGVGLAGVPVAYALFMEFVPPSVRGSWAVFIEIFWTLGTVFEAGLAWLVLEPLGWRALLAISATPLALLLICYPLLPESPRYHLIHGQTVLAQRTLKLVAQVNGKALPPGHLEVPGHHHKGEWQQSEECAHGEVQPTEHDCRVGEGARRAACVSANGSCPDATDAEFKELKVGGRDAKHMIDIAAEGNERCLGEESRLLGTGSSPSGLVSKTQSLVDDIWSSVSQVFHPSLRTITLLLVVVWVCIAMSYYGLVILATQLNISTEAHACADRALQIADNDFKNIMVTSSAEIPALAYAALIAGRLGRRNSIAMSMTLLGLTLSSLLLPSLPTWGVNLSMFFSRLFIHASFSILYVYTPEIYPTSVRTFGLGLCNSCSRVGGLIAPFIAVGLVAEGQAVVAEVIFISIALGTAVAVRFIKVETAGRELQDVVLRLPLNSSRTSSTYSSSSSPIWGRTYLPQDQTPPAPGSAAITCDSAAAMCPRS